MIIAETEHRYRFITQPDHADLAGQFADRWGTNERGRPHPRSAVVLAAYNHDDGWWRYDRRPHLADGEPVDFIGISPDAWIDLYDDGIETVVEMDPHAGLLVSMHGSGLRRQRYGLSPSMPDGSSEFEGFVDRQEELQRKLVADLRGTDRYGRLSEADASFLEGLHESGTPPDGYDSRIWTNYKLLQAWDSLSLTLCTAESPERTTIDAVPVNGGPDETLTVEPVGDDEFRIEPYPFDASPLDVTVPARTVRKSDFDTEAGLVRAYYGAGRELVTFTLRR